MSSQLPYRRTDDTVARGSADTEQRIAPARKCKGLTFSPIPKFCDAEVAFGAPDRYFFRRDDLPEVPREFEKMADAIFFRGERPAPFTPEVDAREAYRALRAWLSSWEPPHEAKVATVAYALWLWTTPGALMESEAASA